VVKVSLVVLVGVPLVVPDSLNVQHVTS